MQENIVYMFKININDIKANLGKVLSVLDKEQIEKANKFNIYDDYLRSLASSYLKKKYKVPFDKKQCNYNGQTASGNFYNISHSSNYVYLALSPKEIGIDVEKVSRFGGKEGDLDYNHALAKRILNNNEKDFVKTSTDLATIWTLKESLLKCKKCGIDRRLVGVPALPLGEKEYDGQEYFCKSMLIDSEYILSITQASSTDFNIILKQEKI